jgi:hypothetical protein
MDIITNNVPREVLYWEDLTDKERAEFAHYEPIDSLFFRYRGWTYDAGDFMPVPEGAFRGWDRYHGDSFYSGIVMKYTDDMDTVIVGTYIS